MFSATTTDQPKPYLCMFSETLSSNISNSVNRKNHLRGFCFLGWGLGFVLRVGSTPTPKTNPKVFNHGKLTYSLYQAGDKKYQFFM